MSERWLSIAACVVAAACRGTPSAEESAARETIARAARGYRPDGQQPQLPVLTAGSPLADYLRYAALRSPRVAERFHAWASEVEEITLARSLPDPVLTLELEVWDSLDALMPGLRQDLPARAKRTAAAQARTHLAGARRREFEAAVAMALARARAACAEAAFREESLAISREVLAIADDMVTVAQTRYRVDQVTQQDVLRAEIEREQLRNELATQEDDRNVLRARLRDALGVAPGEPDPPVPVALPREEQALPQEDLVAAMLARNPGLAALTEEVRAAESLVRLAQAQRRPDVMASLGVNVIDAPFANPELGITLPVWRDKIEAGIASALAQRARAGARLEGERLALVVRLAEASFAHRDAIRRIRLLGGQLLPKARTALDVARAAYPVGKADLTSLLAAQRALYEFRVAEARAWLEREVAHATVVHELLGRAPLELDFAKDADAAGEQQR